MGALISMLITDRAGRKWPLVLLSLVGAVLGYFYASSRDMSMITILGFLIVTVIFLIMTIAWSPYIPEQFPTALRATGNGFSQGMGRLGATAAPYGVVFLVREYGFSGVSIGISVVFLAMAGFIAVLGTETKKKTLEELNEFKMAQGVGNGVAVASEGK